MTSLDRRLKDGNQQKLGKKKKVECTMIDEWTKKKLKWDKRMKDTSVEEVYGYIERQELFLFGAAAK